MLPRTSGIYVITNLKDGKRWVGQAMDMRERMYNHIGALRGGTNSPYLQRAWNKHGAEAFEFSVLMKVPECCLNFWEEHFIELFQTWRRGKGYNISRKASGPPTISPEGRVKMAWMRGRRHSEETKAKIAASNTGRVHSEESRKKISQNTRGVKKVISEEVQERLRASRSHPLAEEHRAAISASLKGRVSHRKGGTLPPETKAKMASSHLGKRWCHNDEKELTVVELPEGFTWGRRKR